MLSVIAIAFSVELLRGEYCINAVEGINSSKNVKNVISAYSVILLFRYSDHSI